MLIRIITILLLYSFVISFNVFPAQVLIVPTITSKSIEMIPLKDVSVNIRHIETNYTYQKNFSETDAISFQNLLSGEHELLFIQNGITIVNSLINLNPDQLKKIEVAVNRDKLTIKSSKNDRLGTSLKEQLWSQLPIKRNITDITLLLPGSTLGDLDLGYLPSISGGTVAENRFELNSFSLTNLADNHNQHPPPLEMIESLSIDQNSSSGGGQISLNLKRGTNTFKSGFSVHYQPSFLSQDKPSSKKADGLYRIDNRDTAQDNLDVNLWSSGPLIEDTLFYYAIYNPRVVKSTTHSEQTIDSNQNITQHTNNYENKSDLWATKLDWHIAKGQRFEYITFSDKQRKLSNEINIPSDPKAFGGQVTQFTYYGQLTNNLSFTGSHSYSNDELYSPHQWNDNPAVYYTSDSETFTKGGQFQEFRITKDSSKQEQSKLNFTWHINDHQIQFEQVNEKVSRDSSTTYSGGKYYLYYIDYSTLENTTPYQFRVREYFGGVSTEMQHNIFSISDNWLITKNWSFDIGLKAGKTTIHNGYTGDKEYTFDDNRSYHISAEYLLNDTDRLNFSLKKQSQVPILSGLDGLTASGYHIETYYDFDGFVDQELGIPNLTKQQPYTGDISTAVGASPNSDSYTTPLKLPEITSISLEYNLSISKNWHSKVHFMHKVLDNAIDDINNYKAFLNNLLSIRGGGQISDYYVGTNYILANPGYDAVATVCAIGVCDDSVNAQELGYPKVQRTYNQITLNTAGNWADGSYLNMSYTWSKLEGNYEGPVSSDFNQIRPNTTLQFDTVEFTEGSQGLLPNDRTHQIKVFGHYPLTDKFNLGFNLLLQSGRPINSFGYHPDLLNGDIMYGPNAFYAEGELSPRGSKGRTSPISNLDISASYKTKIFGAAAEFKIDIFNIFNTLTVTEVDETWDDILNEQNNMLPTKSETYGLATHWQSPLSVQISSRFTF